MGRWKLERPPDKRKYTRSNITIRLSFEIRFNNGRLKYIFLVTMNKPLLFFINIVFFLLVAQASASGDNMLPDAIIYPGDKPGHIIVVDKAEQILYLYSHDGHGNVTLDRVMPCSTGENKGDKLVEGDKKTPNGYYIFNQKLLPRELSPIYGTLAYPTNYPNFWDKKLGRGGYGIWIHGINKPLVDYDSNGCIELENADIAKMEAIINLFDTPLLTYEALTWMPQTELQREADEIKEFIENWRRAWVNKDHQAYKAAYAPEFVNSDGRSFDGWMTHKENVARNYKAIKVEVKDLRLFRHRDVVAAVFEQDYQGDQRFTSIGLKRLYIGKINGRYKILGEEFINLPDTTTRKWLTAAEKQKALETPPLTVAQMKAEAEEKRMAAEAKAQAEAQARQAAEARQKEEARIQADSLAAQLKAEEEARAEAEAAAKAQADADAKAAAEAKIQADAEAKAAAEDKARADAEARKAAEAKAQADAEARASAKAQAEAEGKELKAGLVALVEEWAEAWRQRDAEAYLGFYHSDFHYQARNMGLEAFKEYRGELIRTAEAIEIKLSNFEVQVDGDTAKVMFIQDYRSDSMRDRGRKTLTMKKTDAGWKITAETWKAVNAS